MRHATFVVVLALAAGLAGLHYRVARRRAIARACAGQRRTLAGAIEMYELDLRTEVRMYTPALAQRLVEQGYLCHRMTHPGGPGRFLVTGDALHPVACSVHGTAEERRVARRETTGWLDEAR